MLIDKVWGARLERPDFSHLHTAPWLPELTMRL